MTRDGFVELRDVSRPVGTLLELLVEAEFQQAYRGDVEEQEEEDRDVDDPKGKALAPAEVTAAEAEAFGERRVRYQLSGVDHACMKHTTTRRRGQRGSRLKVEADRIVALDSGIGFGQGRLCGLDCIMMRVVDLDRDMSDVIPTGLTPDSEFLFERMTRVSLQRTGAGPGKRILDVASGVGQDSIALAALGASVVGAEPSGRMTGMARLFAADRGGPMPDWVRGWSDRLPFATGSFDACVCKGALDHFDAPEKAIGEMSRVTRCDGRVVLAIANFESLACRMGRFVDDFRQDMLGWEPIRPRRGYDAPSDHFTRYEPELIREQAEKSLIIESLEGISAGWGMPGWSYWSSQIPRPLADVAVRSLDRVGRQWPVLSDVIVLAGRPRRSSNTSA